MIAEKGIYAKEDQPVKKGIAAGGISLALTLDNLSEAADAPRILKVATPHPFPEQLAVRFLEGLDEVLVIEELDPVIEKELVYIAGKYHLNVTVKGKLTGDTETAGENSPNLVAGRGIWTGSLEGHLPEKQICLLRLRFRSDPRSCARDVPTEPLSMQSRRL